MLNECGENIPQFVSHYLDELLLDGFRNMDASALLSRMEQFSQEVVAMRIASEEQAYVSNNLRKATEAMERRVAVIEKSSTKLCSESREPTPQASGPEVFVERQAPGVTAEPSADLTQPCHQRRWASEAMAYGKQFLSEIRHIQSRFNVFYGIKRIFSDFTPFFRCYAQKNAGFYAVIKKNACKKRTVVAAKL